MYNFSSLSSFVFFAFVLTPTISIGVDLGVKAKTFPVTEEAFTEMIKRKLGGIDLDAHQKGMQEKAKRKIENPDPVKGIIPAKENRTFYHDPSYVLDSDVILPCGKLLYRAGTRVNPLDHMDLDRKMIFIDARYQNQKDWLIEYMDQENPHTKEKIRIILVGGSVLKLKEELGKETGKNIYFDQFGELTMKFGIKASPGVVKQEGKRLKIEEIFLEDK